MLTPDEVKVVEEALYQYRVSIDEDHEGRQMPEQSRWAHERAEKLRRAMAAAIDGRPYRDVNAQRTAPAAPSGPTTSDLPAASVVP